MEYKAIPLERFGKDHWTTFAYIETRIVDHNGVLNLNQMRIDRNIHPVLFAAKPAVLARWDHGSSSPQQYPTKLKSMQRSSKTGLFETEELHNHDDYDCVQDLITSGLIEMTMPEVKNEIFVDHYGKPCLDLNNKPIIAHMVTGMTEQLLLKYARFRLTPKGERVIGEYRLWKSNRHNSHQFVPSEASLRAGESKSLELQ